MTTDAAENMRCMLPADAFISIGCIIIAWGTLIAALI